MRHFLQTLLLCLPGLLLGQTIPQTMMFTVGTTARDVGGQDHAFLIWEAPGTDLFGGKAFAIYGKAGVAASSSTFSQEGIITGSLQTATITQCLQQAESLGQSLTDFDGILAGIHYGCFYPNAAPELTGDRVAKTIAVLTKARTVPALTGKLRSIVMTNPTLALCLGLAWSAPMLPASTTKTYELREWNVAAGTDGAVIGRVTLTGGAPVVLPATSRPVQLVDGTPRGDLQVRLRWGVPDGLKRRIMLHQGYRLYRLPWSLVQAQGYQNTPPSVAQLTAHIAAGEAVPVTKKPLYLSKTLTPAQSVDFTAPLDSQISYLDDDFGRVSDPANYVMPGDGAEFGYIVTPRDVLGRHGLPSLAGHGQFRCTQSPSVPRDPKVELVYGAPDAQGVRPQHFHFSFLANADNPANPTTFYEVYRGTGPSVDSHNQPLPADLIMILPHPAQPGRVVHDDMPPYPFNHNQQVWFAVRAVRSTPGGVFNSPLSPLVHSALVLNAPPQAPTMIGRGSLCPQPGIILDGTSVADGAVDGLNHFRMICTRLDNQVLKASFYSKSLNGQEELLDEMEFSDDDRAQVDFTLPDYDVGHPTTFICRVSDYETGQGAAESIFVRPGGALNADKVFEMRFLAAVLSPTSLDPNNKVSNFFLDRNERRELQSVMLSSGARPFVVGRASTLIDAQGYLVERLIGADWMSVGFAHRSGEDVVFKDRTVEGPTTTAANYRLTPLMNLRACPTNGPTFFSVTSQNGRANCVRNCLSYAPDPNNEPVEYRFYRRVNNGPLALYAEGRVTSATPNPICETDCSLPATGGTVQYYGQVIGANGVGSALVYGGAVVAVAATLPRPVLAEPQGSGTAEEPKVTLTWTCPVESVERFEITITANGFEHLTSSVPAAALDHVTHVRRRSPPSNSAVSPVNAAIASATLFVPPMNVETLLTDRVGSASLGAGPVFTQQIPVLANMNYSISISALGPDGAHSKDSAEYAFRWQLPKALDDPDLPWPFRALPTVSTTAGEVANLNDANAGDTAIWPVSDSGQVGFAIGSINTLNNDSLIELRTRQEKTGVYFQPDTSSRLVLGGRDFNSYLYRRTSSADERVLPAVLYRQQLPNGEWPNVSGDVVQVSPLITKILWTDSPLSVGEVAGGSFLRDPFIAVRPLSDDNEVRLYLLDTTPRAVGAKYRYWLVCFNKETGAPEYVIPATLDEVTP